MQCKFHYVTAILEKFVFKRTTLPKVHFIVFFLIALLLYISCFETKYQLIAKGNVWLRENDRSSTGITFSVGTLAKSSDEQLEETFET